VRERIVAEARGNPLALLELPRGLTAAEMAGGFALPDAGPLASRIEQSFLRQLHALPDETRRLLLTAAAEPVGDVPLLWRAAERLGIAPDAAAPAEAAGLIELGARVRFRHPLVRSAAYRAAEAPDRQAVHRALADATDPDADPDRRAWHRAHAATGPDEAVASELERSSEPGAMPRRARRGRRVPHARDRADACPGRRAARALAAAQATYDAGAPEAAAALLAAAAIGPLDDLQRARLARLRAQLVFARRRGGDATPLLLDAAQRLAPLDARLAREAYLEAFAAALFAGRLGDRDGVRKVADAARAAPPAPEPPRPLDLLFDGLATRFTDGYVAGVPPLRRALHAFRREAGRSEDGVERGTQPWVWQAIIVAADLWDDETRHELATRAVSLAREAGALSVLPIFLESSAIVHTHAGEFAEASALIEQAGAVIDATGNAPFRHAALLLAAWRGDEALAVPMIDARVRDATARGEGRAIGPAMYATAVLYNGLGRYDAALAGAERACEYEDLVFFGYSLVELVEAGARIGARAVAADALRRLEERTQASGTDWALGLQARSRALLSDGEAADALYREAVERLARTRINVHLARAHLVYGEWLRRAHRRVEAREHLRLAYGMLGRMGAEAFAERARQELLATGETVRKRTAAARDGLTALAALTAQEARVARLAAEGRTNPEIGSQLFISPRTAQYHLRKVFAKLGVSSRRALRDALRTAAGIEEPA
jgi:DNA-binding CsgD family transcriptional regulator